MTEVDFEDLRKLYGDKQALQYVMCEALTVSASVYQNQRQLPSNCHHVLQLIPDAEVDRIFDSNDLHIFINDKLVFSESTSQISAYQSALRFWDVTWGNLCSCMRTVVVPGSQQKVNLFPGTCCPGKQL